MVSTLLVSDEQQKIRTGGLHGVWVRLHPSRPSGR
jgi:hypothetical protein